MANFNKVLLMGNLTRDPELRYTPSGTAVCEFGLAVNRTYTTKEGEKRDDTCFVDVTMWGRRGVVISEYFTKGSPIFVEGRLNYDSWETSEGRRSRLTVVAENFEFIGGRSAGQREGGGRSSSRPQRAEQQRPQREPEAEDYPDEGFDVADDEIPF
ncbi:MAG: single-stranded DNA-binding protein [Planctomycetes bacterium SM23_32]|nr:MAG: single-stranded DNA-binding protein [Planctomycetes bacterium SM23_32]